MKDDLLIRFIDGKTTPEETEAVLEVLSRDGDAAKEWLYMVQGARLAGTKPIQEVDLPAGFISGILAKSQLEQKQSSKVVRLPWILSGIAAVAASVAIIVTVTRNTDNVVIEGLVAETMNESAVPTDTILTVENPEVEVVEIKAVDNKKAEGKILDLTGSKMIEDNRASTAGQFEAASFEMLKPSKSPYRVRVRNPKKEFVFEWKMNGVSSVSVQINDKDGNKVIDSGLLQDCRFPVVASMLVDKGELDWTVKISFMDGSSETKTGKLEFDLYIE